MEQIVLIFDVVAYILRYFLAIFFWPYPQALYCSAPVLIAVLASLIALRTRFINIGAVSLVILVVLFVWTAPLLVTATLLNGYQVTFSNTPDGDFDREWIQVERPDGAIASAIIDWETDKCWPTLSQTVSRISFSCVNGWGGAQELFVLTETLEFHPADCYSCVVTIENLKFNTIGTGTSTSVLYTSLVPVIQLVSLCLTLGIIFHTIITDINPSKTLANSRNFVVSFLLIILIGYLFYWYWVFTSTFVLFGAFYYDVLGVLFGPSLFPVILLLGYGISSFVAWRSKLRLRR